MQTTHMYNATRQHEVRLRKSAYNSQQRKPCMWTLLFILYTCPLRPSPLSQLYSHWWKLIMYQRPSI